MVRTLYQGRRPDRAGAESTSDLVDRPLRLPPADRAIIERQLGIRAGRRDQAGYPDADEPEPRAMVETSRLIQRAGCGMNLTSDVSRMCQRPVLEFWRASC